MLIRKTNTEVQNLESVHTSIFQAFLRSFLCGIAFLYLLECKMRLQKRFCIRLIVSNVVRAFLPIEYMVLNIYTSVYKHINCVFYRSVTVCLTSSLTTLNSIALFHKIYPIGKLRLIHTICPATFFLTAHISSLSLSLSLGCIFRCVLQ